VDRYKKSEISREIGLWRRALLW